MAILTFLLAIALSSSSANLSAPGSDIYSSQGLAAPAISVRTISIPTALPSGELFGSESPGSFGKITLNGSNPAFTTPFFRRQTVLAAIPLMVGGSLLIGNDVRIRNLRNDHLWGYRKHWDDALQYSPAAVMLGLKAFGVKGRSSWGRMLISDAFSVATLSLAVNGIKLFRLRQRPDASDRRSFPSGHTATVFMTATMLHKEYGTTVSPWISVGGYTIATATALGRMINNKHWLSDVMVGAGLGILATELGYLLADMIFAERHLLRSPHESTQRAIDRKSFISLNFGLDLATLGRGAESHTAQAGIEGAWFFSDRFGVGGTASLMRNPRNYPGGVTDSWCLSRYIFQTGLYFITDLGRNWQLLSKLLAGHQTSRLIESGADGGPKVYGRDKGIVAETGISFRKNISDHLGMRLFVDCAYFPRSSFGSDSSSLGVRVSGAFFMPKTGFSIDILL